MKLVLTGVVCDGAIGGGGGESEWGTGHFTSGSSFLKHGSNLKLVGEAAGVQAHKRSGVEGPSAQVFVCKPSFRGA